VTGDYATTPTPLDKYRAAIFDLDGVVTRTASVHAAAWKEVFDTFLKERAAAEGGEFTPFDLKNDYLEHVDGKPRYEGVKDFLSSRGIELPFGHPDDPPSHATVTGLGNTKNDVFRAVIAGQGAEVFPAAVALIKDLRRVGVRVGLVTSSKNGALILESTGLADLFDAVVDGTVSAELGLKGKPHPDAFLEASRRLGLGPEHSVVFEDALSGVQAGRAGGYALVVGVDRHGDSEGAMLEAGADLVVRDLAGFTTQSSADPVGEEPGTPHRETQGDDMDQNNEHPMNDLPSALTSLTLILEKRGNRKLVIFLDYDGTLTPIVDRPEWALIPDDTKATLARLAGRFPVAVVSGRDLDDVRKLVGLEGLTYAGSHGFDVLLASGERKELEEAEESLPLLNGVEKELAERLKNIEGSLVERKRYSVAVHYRLVGESEVDEVERAVEEAAAAYPDLRRTGGKKVFELRPGLDWHKGKALGWILETLGLDPSLVFPLFLGDDLTDEDAFAHISGWGAGIVVRDPEPRPTKADYVLEDPQEVQEFLEELLAQAGVVEA
jgi:alpha,alpha-trehalase